MRVAFYGNNLNQGYFFCKALREFGIDACLFSPSYAYKQEEYSWWLRRKEDDSIVQYLNFRFDLSQPEPLITNQKIRELYDQVSKYDLIIMMEDGPGVFSELEFKNKIFLSQGSDLQILPFLMRYHCGPRWSVKSLYRRYFDAEFKKLYFESRDNWRRAEGRQRLGIRSCKKILCGPNQVALARSIGCSTEQMTFMPFPMHTDYLKDIDEREVGLLTEKYKDIDIIFFHPTRQFFLNLKNDLFLKDNDKLILGYSKYMRHAKKNSKLILIEKGREEDIAAAKEIIQRLGIERQVEWLKELSNIQLRAFYSLNRLVICDQFNSNIATLGNIGRESAYYGAPIITAFSKYNRLLYGTDMPPHVFAAETASQIAKAMSMTEAVDDSRLPALKSEAQDWFERNCNYKNLMPRYIEFFKRTALSP